MTSTPIRTPVTADTRVGAYLARLGLRASDVVPLTPRSLGLLVSAHVARVPFNNVHIHRGMVAATQPEEVLARVVDRGSGGICYELNGGLGLLLSALGADTRFLGAAVRMTGRDGTTTLGPPLGHMAFEVAVESRSWLADVGFGGEAILQSLPDDGEIVTSPSGASYVLDRRPLPLEAFAAMAWWHSTSPGSRFLGSLIVSATSACVTRTLSGKGEPLAFSMREDGRAREVTRADAERIAAEDFGVPDALPDALVAYAPSGSARQWTGKGDPT